MCPTALLYLVPSRQRFVASAGKRGDMTGSAESDLFGKADQVAVERGLVEFAAGRPVILTSPSEATLVLPIDGLTDAVLAGFRRLCAPERPYLLITARRARALGLEAAGPTGLAVGELPSAAALLSLAADQISSRHFQPVAAGETAGAAIALAKLAQLLPALLVGPKPPNRARAGDVAVVRVPAHAVPLFRRAAADSLVITAQTSVPLNSDFGARFVVFRDRLGGSPVAVIVGSPDFSQPVAVRLHSACLTGDVFGSRRCDCGDQLRMALKQLQQHGGGIILYLEQEGRGLGLANKIRSYALQEAGLDTVDANTVLGFEDDERDYGIAVRMLQMLGCTRVRLLTNNPAKLAGLSAAGIDVSGRVPLQGPVHPDNRRYLAAKAMRAGHQLDHLLGTLSDKE